MSREEPMRNHPSYRARIVRDAQYRREVEDNFRALAEAELFAGGSLVPESAEVREHRLDMQACALGSSNAAPRPEPLTWREQVGPVAGIIVAFAVVAWTPAIAQGLWGWLA